MKPDGYTLHSCPSITMSLAGILADLRFIIDARRVENAVGRVCMRDCQRSLVVSFDELDECALKAAFLEDAESAAGRSVMTCLLYTSDAADERSSVDLG